MNQAQGLLFDLDGVIVDTAKYHFLAWKQLAEELGVTFTQTDNERLKGVSRMASLEIILDIGQKKMTQEEKERCCEKKNQIYVSYINKLGKDEILPGVKEFLVNARENGYKTALGSASKNSKLILDKLEINNLFDAIIDGTKVSKAKPDPEVFAQGAKALGINNAECIVFEDAVAGIQAAHNGGMKAIGIGSPSILTEADLVIPGFKNISISNIISKLVSSVKKN